MKFSLPININIPATLRAWRSELVGGNILSVDDVRFKNFDPATTFGSMATSNYVVNSARGISIGSLFIFRLDIQATLAATLGPEITVTFPVVAAGQSTEYQGFSGVGQDASAGEGCIAQIAGGSSALKIYRPTTANYSAGAWRARINGILEID